MATLFGYSETPLATMYEEPADFGCIDCYAPVMSQCMCTEDEDDDSGEWEDEDEDTTSLDCL